VATGPGVARRLSDATGTGRRTTPADRATTPHAVATATVAATRSATPPPVPRPTVTPTAAAVAARFARAIGTQRTDPIRPLPSRMRTLARTVAGTDAVSLRTGPATARALADAGKPAATIGRVIHLPAPPDGSVRSTELLAHELVHAGRPSSEARFFDDDRDSHEESVARAVGSLARALSEPKQSTRGRTDAVAAQGTAGLPVRGGFMVFGGQGGTGTGGAASSVSASPVVQRSMTGSPDAGGPAVPLIARFFEEQSSSPPVPPVPPTAGADRSGGDVNHPRPGDAPFVFGRSPVTGNPSTPKVGESTAPLSAEAMEWLLDALEQRVVDELERRGLRHNPGVF